MAVDPDMARLLFEREGDGGETVCGSGSSAELRSQPVVD